MNISNLLTSYLKDNQLNQYQLADEVNDVVGWQYITPMAVSYWVNNVYRPDIKTARIVQAAATGKLRELFGAIISELENAKVLAD